MMSLPLALSLLLTLTPVPSPAATPVPFPTTDGDILSSSLLYLGSGPALAVGGNFHHVGSTPADNVAVIDVRSQRILYAGHTNGYVASVMGHSSALYIGGDFTTLDGKPRNRIASVSTNTWQLTSFNPGAGGRVRAIEWAQDAIVYGSPTSVRAALPGATTPLWTIPLTGGPAYAILARHQMYGPTEDVLYVGGQYEQIGDFRNHGLARILVRSNHTVVVDHFFAPKLRPDSNVGPKGSYDGEEVLSLAWKQPDNQLAYGWGGAITNGIGTMTADTAHVWWAKQTDGDAQALAAYDNTILGGWHRGHGWSTDQHWPWFAGALNANTGLQQQPPWDPLLTGNPPNNLDGGNGGVHGLNLDAADRLLFVTGAFTTYGATCSVQMFTCSTAGTPRRSIAVFRY